MSSAAKRKAAELPYVIDEDGNTVEWEWTQQETTEACQSKTRYVRRHGRLIPYTVGL